jgi:phosphoserine phosphatase
MTVHRMTHVATLISNPARPTVITALVDAVRSELPGAGKPQWLAQNIAADIPFVPPPGTESRAIANGLRERFADGIDVVVQPAAGRRKTLFLADMDSTMIGQECIDELADFVNLKTHVAAITERAMRGEIAFEPALRERVALLKGLPAAVIEEVIRDRIRLTPGARTLVMTMRANGAYTCLVSGGFKSFTDRIAAMIGFDENRSNVLEVGDDGKLAGLVREPIFGREAKLQALLDLRRDHSVAKDATLVTGDGANDLSMIQEAGLGVAYHAKPAVAEAAHARIDHGDLTALLYLQGYRRDQFVEA